MKKIFFLLLTIVAIYSLNADIDSMLYLGKAPAIYQSLNTDPKKPFVLSVGTSASQTYHTSNTCHPHALRAMLHQQAQASHNPLTFLKSAERIWYILRSLPIVQCTSCKKIFNLGRLDLKKDHLIINKILQDLANNADASMLSMTKCPLIKCNNAAIIELEDPITYFTAETQKLFLQTLETLTIHDQIGTQSSFRHIPSFRFSIEASDILYENSLNIDHSKLTKLTHFIKSMHNPIIFMHHYGNPKQAWDLFQHEQDIEWFANYCETIVKNCPELTHICPISQPVGFFFRTYQKKDLPPFICNIDTQQYFDNIITAQVEASKRMKAINPQLQILFSHQWKIMKPKHDAPHPYHFIERMLCPIAHIFYNGKFINALEKYSDYFDGIALSVYPGIRLNLWTPEVDNCSGVIDWQEALQTIMQTHQAFPNKPIYIIEAGCNTDDPKKKKEFIDMILYVCKLARDQGVDIAGVWLWSLTNDEKYYSEWNKAPGSTNFGVFDTLDPKSINAAGKYIQEIIKNQLHVSLTRA